MNIKNIAFGIFCTSMLFSCTKEDMEVQKNTDLTWEVREDLVKNDVRTSIGYDPKSTYVVPNVSTLNYSVVALQDLIFSAKEKKKLEIKVLGKPSDNDIKVTLEYDPTLYQEFVDTKYGGYALGGENLVTIDQKQKVIPAGKTSVEFELSGNFTDFSKVILPYSVKTESVTEIKQLGNKLNQFVVKTNASSFFNGNFVVKISESSTKFAKVYSQFLKMPKSTAQYGNRFILLNENVYFGKLDNKLGVKFVLNFDSTTYEAKRYVELDETNFTIKPVETASNNFFDTSGYNRDWSFFKADLEDVLEIFTTNAPYKYEKVDSLTVKIISEDDPEMWFVMRKQ